MNFNLNDMMRVRLTPAGRAWHCMTHALFNANSGLSLPYEPINEVEGWSTWIVWEFMWVFGPEMIPGNPMPVCDMNVVLVPAEASGVDAHAHPGADQS